ncbi:bifunctional serine/threonine protein kinase/MFS transporter [Streptomyces sp. NPDC048142]|uniref:bifunctional serine/threonine protein kinase/MFS transporter n=1 Tax=Streptomyces sp. NPDC048142 TaxID=3365501 RepID=UPI0037108CB4
MEQLTGQDPAHIGPYRLIARLGEGGMGLVYLGRSDLGRTVAVKVVQAEHAQHPEFRRRFAREVAAARRVGGDWTAAVLDADTEAATPWVATQYIPGPDLTTVVGRDFGPLPEHSVHTLANRLALALQAVHDAGLIHRDLKPSNVLVTVDGPRVIDFGIARALDSVGGDSLLTRTGMLIGSPGFMSPEQVRGHELTPANDLFCLGAVLVHAATGRLLFGATDTGLNAHLFRIAEEEPDLTGVPDSLLDLVRACLHKEPARRPTTAQVIERTATDRPGEWLPGSVLAQLGRKAAELLDFAPEVRGAQPDPRARGAQSDPRARPAHPDARPEPTSYPLPPATPPPPHAPNPNAAPSPYAAPNPYAPTVAPAGDGVAPNPRRWWGLAMATFAQLVVLVHAASTPALLYWAVEDLEFATYDLDQIYVGYALAFCSLLLVGGHIADLIGRRATLLIGLTGFAVAAVVGATAAGGDALVWSLVLRGVFAALIAPASFGLVAAQFTGPKERGRAFGIYSAAGLGGIALALIIAMPLTDLLNWRLSLYVVAGLALVALTGTAALVRDRGGRTPARFDGPGALLSTLGVGAVVFGLAQLVGGWSAWGEPLMVPVLGIVLLAAFAWQQSRAASPILPTYATRTRDSLGASLTLFLTTLALTPVVSFLGEFLRSVSLSASLAAFLGMTGAFLIGSLAVSARLLPRIGPRVLLVPGLLLAAVGVLIIQSAQEALSSTIPSMVCIAVGLGMAGTVLYSAITDGVAAHDSGGRGGLVMVNQHMGGELAFALLGGGMLQLSFNNPALFYGSAGVLAVAALLGGLLVKGPARTAAPAEPWSAPTLPR